MSLKTDAKHVHSNFFANVTQSPKKLTYSSYTDFVVIYTSVLVIKDACLPVQSFIVHCLRRVLLSCSLMSFRKPLQTVSIICVEYLHMEFRLFDTDFEESFVCSGLTKSQSSVSISSHYILVTFPSLVFFKNYW